MNIIQLLDLNAEFDSFYNESIKLNLDYCFKHFNTVNEIDTTKPVVITDLYLKEIDKIKNEIVYLWLMEPHSVSPWAYEQAYYNKNRFKLIFSHNKKFCESIDTVKWYPWGSYFIPTSQHKIYNKNKNVSIVVSAKCFTEGHYLRHQVIQKYQNLLDGFKWGNPVEPKIQWHDEYRYSIAIENKAIRGYFTEKIIDCFRTGTIPIYKGDSEIKNYFDENGIIIFDNIEELKDILPKCNKELYESKIESIIKNFNLAENYLYPWKYIKENYL